MGKCANPGRFRQLTGPEADGYDEQYTAANLRACRVKAPTTGTNIFRPAVGIPGLSGGGGYRANDTYVRPRAGRRPPGTVGTIADVLEAGARRLPATIGDDVEVELVEQPSAE